MRITFVRRSTSAEKRGDLPSGLRMEKTRPADLQRSQRGPENCDFEESMAYKLAHAAMRQAGYSTQLM